MCTCGACAWRRKRRSSSLAGEEQVRRAAGLSLKVEAVARFCFHMDMVVTYYEAPHKALEAQRRCPLKTWHVRAPRPPATRIWRWSELFGQQSRLRRRDSRRWLDKLRMSTMPSVSRGVASHRYNGRKSGATTAELDAQWRKFSAGCCVPPSKWSATARWMASGVGTCMVFACCARVPSSSARRACARARTAVAASGLLSGSGASPRPARPTRRTQHRHGHATCLPSRKPASAVLTSASASPLTASKSFVARSVCLRAAKEVRGSITGRSWR